MQKRMVIQANFPKYDEELFNRTKDCNNASNVIREALRKFFEEEDLKRQFRGEIYVNNTK